MLKTNDILNEVLLKDILIKEEIGIYSRARPTIPPLLVLLKIAIRKLRLLTDFLVAVSLA